MPQNKTFAQKEIINLIKKSILFSVYKSAVSSNKKELAHKTENVYEEIFKEKIELSAQTRLPPLLISGEPGTGKTYAFKQAASEVAKSLGLNFVNQPVASEYEAAPNDFIFYATEAIEASGPSFSNLNLLSESNLQKDLNALVPQYEKAAGGVFLIDEAHQLNGLATSLLMYAIDDRSNNASDYRNIPFAFIKTEVGDNYENSFALTNRCLHLKIENGVNVFEKRNNELSEKQSSPSPTTLQEKLNTFRGPVPPTNKKSLEI